MIEECLCNETISKNTIEQRFGIVFDDYFKPELERLIELECDGLIEARASRTIRVTPSGRIFSRAVAKMFDAFESAAV